MAGFCEKNAIQIDSPGILKIKMFMSKVQIIVDENDEIIGFKDRNETAKDDIYRVTGLWLENSQGEILMAQRSFSKKNGPGKWGPAVSGTVEKGETYDSNITKEAEEEIGLKNIKFQKGEKMRVTGNHNYFAQWYFAKLDKKAEDFKINKEEVEQVGWFTVEELEKKIKDSPEKVVSGLQQMTSLWKK
jgi:isopentenyl-diphosphate Delta-isomerase